MTQPERRKVFFHTFGCQMNEYDTGKMRALLGTDGYEPTDDPGSADLILVNTCSVRDKAEQKMHSVLGEYRRLKREGQPLTIGITGCVAQQEGATLLERYADLDLVMGPDGVPAVRELVRAASSGERVLDTEFLDLDDYPFIDDVDPAAAGAVSANVTIQKGCDNKCTFCIVPTTRGAEVSRPAQAIVDETRALVDTGVKEVVLIGQNVNSYGLKRGDIPFAELLYRVADIEGLERIRYTTSHPRDMGEDVARAYADLPKLTSHLHLPVQSGSSRILRRMKRFYTRERFLEVVAMLREARPELVLTTDLIVGFPGETEEDFQQTMSLVDAAGFVSAYSFKYSPRPGVPALRLPDDVPPEVASDRLTRLQTRLRERSQAFHTGLENTAHTVLVYGPSRHDEGVVAGRTSHNVPINFPGSTELVGRFVDVVVTKGFTNSCRGERVPLVPVRDTEQVPA